MPWTLPFYVISECLFSISLSFLTVTVFCIVLNSKSRPSWNIFMWICSPRLGLQLPYSWFGKLPLQVHETCLSHCYPHLGNNETLCFTTWKHIYNLKKLPKLFHDLVIYANIVYWWLDNSLIILINKDVWFFEFFLYFLG